jgi:hypothetical protein
MLESVAVVGFSRPAIVFGVRLVLANIGKSSFPFVLEDSTLCTYLGNVTREIVLFKTVTVERRSESIMFWFMMQ